jgi:hypothetical protein
LYVIAPVKTPCFISLNYFLEGSRNSSVGIATRYGLEGPGIESRWDEIFRIYLDRLRGPPSHLYNGYRVFPGGKGGRGVMLTTTPSSAEVKKELSYTSTHPMGPPGAVTGFPLPFTFLKSPFFYVFPLVDPHSFHFSRVLLLGHSLCVSSFLSPLFLVCNYSFRYSSLGTKRRVRNRVHQKNAKTREISRIVLRGVSWLALLSLYLRAEVTLN